IESQRQHNVALASFSGHLAKAAARWVEIHSAAGRSAYVRVIDEVECFRPELESSGVVNCERLKQSQVPVLEAGLINQVPDILVAERAGSRRNEDRASVRIARREPLARILASIGCKLAKNLRIPGDVIKLARITASEAAILADANKIVLLSDAARRAALELCEAADLPAAENLAGKTLLAAEDRQLIEIVEHQHMAAVEFRRSPQVVGIVGVRNHIALVRSVVIAGRKRVRNAEQKALGKPAIPAQLQRVIARVGNIVT